MTKLVYLTDSYKKTLVSKISTITKQGNQWEVILPETIFYPQGGGQPSDRGEIVGKHGKLIVTHVRMRDQDVVHEGKLNGHLKTGETVTAHIDWTSRFDHMRWHSAGHVLHEIIIQTVPGLTPAKGEHGKHAFIEYRGDINPRLKETLEKQTNMLIAEGRPIHTEMVSLEDLKKRVSWVPEHLPKNKPLRILQISGFAPTPDGGTQVKNTSEIGQIFVSEIEQLGETVRVHYHVSDLTKAPIQPAIKPSAAPTNQITLDAFRSLLLEMQNQLLELVSKTASTQLEQLKVNYFGSHGIATQLIKQLKDLPQLDRKTAGILVNEFKSSVDQAFTQQLNNATTKEVWFDVSLPGILPPEGHLHIVTQAIIEITRIFERIGFSRVRHPEVDWDYYAFESLNMPPDHPARDEWETFFIDHKFPSPLKGEGQGEVHKGKIVLTPHTSNGQVREMEKGKLPIRMINIAKCYRRQSDVSHVPMFHQFEGLFVDKNASIGDLKGVMDYFFKQYYGPDRKSRLRPFHFQFTEPSFEVDINCGVCLGKAHLPDGQGCKLCKDGWLELGGAGMVHPNVLKAGKIDPDKYNGFAFGWGVERVAMMKSGTQLDDIRLLYSNDLRFLEQF
ncbi:MAG: Phenylalanine-tRNA ligase alpha subunit [Candidatus Gottesmanbacteria bacterium GW2011_GWA2_42_16]|nr:MAG: Phenylalanine-tRNA ligase alpha subunit [Candidatus Gottesmanbacteria bacterium GW2011_GWA2_42_16]